MMTLNEKREALSNLMIQKGVQVSHNKECQVYVFEDDETYPNMVAYHTKEGLYLLTDAIVDKDFITNLPCIQYNSRTYIGGNAEELEAYTEIVKGGKNAV